MKNTAKLIIVNYKFSKCENQILIFLTENITLLILHFLINNHEPIVACRKIWLNKHPEKMILDIIRKNIIIYIIRTDVSILRSKFHH